MLALMFMTSEPTRISSKSLAASVGFGLFHWNLLQAMASPGPKINDNAHTIVFLLYLLICFVNPDLQSLLISINTRNQ